MTRSIKLVAFDCGTTTTSAVVATARLTAGSVGRVEITQVEPTFHSETTFTPFDGDRIDAERLEARIDGWLADAGVAGDEIFAGGALVTGLAAQRANAASVTRLIAARLADAVVATADDPRLESWLAFMGNSRALSIAHPDTQILNLDVGGGTTNLAWGADGQVTSTASLFVGARHFQFRPGTYRLTALSPYAQEVLEHLRIKRSIGDTCERAEIDAILDFYVALVEAAALGNDEALQSAIARRHVQAGRPSATICATPIVTLSGGVGQLAYARLRGEPPGGTTQFGDLGGELADRLSAWTPLAGSGDVLVPEGLGRATVYGLLRHGTELSGRTIYLPKPQRLPLANVPIVARIRAEATTAELAQAVDMAAHGAAAGCLRIELADSGAGPIVRALGHRLADVLATRPFPRDRTLVLLLSANLGKLLGSYATRWGTLDNEVIVIDEVPDSDSQFLRLGRYREGTVPLWLYGMR